MMISFTASVLLGSVAVLIAALVAAERRGRLRTAFVRIVAALVAAWALAVLAVRYDYRDAGGSVDCWPSCTAWQTAAGTTLVYAPPSAFLVVLATVALLTLRRRRTRRDPRSS